VPKIKRRRPTRGGPRDAALLYPPEALRADFVSEDILSLDVAEADLSEGPMHVGARAVVGAPVRRR
jgi:hypothetical protein